VAADPAPEQQAQAHAAGHWPAHTSLWSFLSSASFTYEFQGDVLVAEVKMHTLGRLGSFSELQWHGFIFVLFVLISHTVVLQCMHANVCVKEKEIQSCVLHTIRLELRLLGAVLLAVRLPGAGSRIPLRNLSFPNGNSLRQNGRTRFLEPNQSSMIASNRKAIIHHIGLATLLKPSRRKTIDINVSNRCHLLYVILSGNCPVGY
jgi:hypothetical protein